MTSPLIVWSVGQKESEPEVEMVEKHSKKSSIVHTLLHQECGYNCIPSFVTIIIMRISGNLAITIFLMNLHNIGSVSSRVDVRKSLFCQAPSIRRKLTFKH